VKNRRSLTPSTAVPGGEVHATRRAGAQHEVSVRVTLTSNGGAAGKPAQVLEGWALNVSRGGVRVILEEKVELGSEFEVELGEDGPEPATSQPGRIVWVQEEPDGVVAGIAFHNAFVSGDHEMPPATG